MNNGKYVLFSGTGCQCSGLLSYLKTASVDCSNLYTCDLICHGVPSPKVFKDYFKFIEKKHGTIRSFEFREKGKYSWTAHVEKIVTDRKTLYQDIYTNFFYDAWVMRLSCFNCRYASVKRETDFTLADFWYLERKHKEFADLKRGVSMVLLNTEKGRLLFNEAKKYTENILVNVRDYMQPHLSHPTEQPQDYDKKWIEYNKNGIEWFIEKYGNNTYTLLERSKRTCKTFVYKSFRFVKVIAKRLLKHRNE